MSTLIGTLNVTSLSNGFWFEIIEGHPSDAVAEVRGERVLIPGREGLYTPANNFEPDHLLIKYHGIVVGTGSTHAAAQASFASRMATLRTACDVATRGDVVLTEGDYIINAGFVRFTGPSASILGNAGRELDIEFIATDPPEWAAS